MRRITAMDLLSRKQMGVSRGEQGSVLVIALLFASVLTIMGVSFLTISGTDISIVFNETNHSQAFYLAEAGIAEATRVLRDSNDWDNQLGAPQPFPCPGGMVPVADGGCTFRVENDAADPGGPANDTNDRVVVRATGTFRNAAKEVDIGLTRLLIPVPPGGLTSIG
ncbi:MAG: pilus assembly PilX family protein, partial [Candidatus Methylomirabilales bacterium]